MPECASILVAAGRGHRFAGAIPKQYLTIAGEPLLRHAARRFLAHPGIDSVLAVIHPDDAAVAEAAGLAVTLVAGGEANFKITGPEDLARAERMLGDGPGLGAWATRVGTGFDVHAFEPGRAVMICGVEIPHPMKLAGHSDADVGLHALTDALLGAAGKGDIGVYFPPSDAKWKGAASEIFIKAAGDMIAADGGRIENLDVTIICEAPRIGPHREAMRARVADILGIAAARVNIKGKTTEKLGFLGRGEGIAAQAVASVAYPVRTS